MKFKIRFINMILTVMCFMSIVPVYRVSAAMGTVNVRKVNQIIPDMNGKVKRLLYIMGKLYIKQSI